MRIPFKYLLILPTIQIRFCMALKIIKHIGKTLLLFISLILLIIVVEYILCPVYKFNTPMPFSGTKIFNPYQKADFKHWKKANFQVQSYAWLGITAGRENSNEVIYETYKSQWYDIIGTSDYQKINRFRSGEPGYVAVYEHGYGIKKNHQVMIGARKVLWTDYPFFQSLHNKQHVLNLLRKGSDLTYIAHPRFRNGYAPEDMTYLSNYDGVEVLNNYRTSPAHWDSALSAGNYVTILGDDDAHDVSNPDEIGHHCTFINSASTDQEEIILALKEGRAYGAKIMRPNGESFEDKRERTKLLPAIKMIRVTNDTLKIATDSPANEIRFIGQGGKVLTTTFDADSAAYKISRSDTYVRAEIEYSQGITYYLNPVCRTNQDRPAKFSIPEVDIYRTALLRVLGFGTLIFIFVNIFVFRKKFRRKPKL